MIEKKLSNLANSINDTVVKKYVLGFFLDQLIKFSTIKKLILKKIILILKKLNLLKLQKIYIRKHKNFLQ